MDARLTSERRTPREFAWHATCSTQDVAISLCIQDWITIGGGTGTTEVSQSERAWVDVSLYQDIVSYIEIADYAPATPIPSIGL